MPDRPPITQGQITEGQTAPAVTLNRDGGASVSLTDFPGRKIVLFTYGQDGTPTCTNEVMEFDALLPQFQAAGAVVIGLSKDSVKSHDKFKAKKSISLILASDHGGTMMEDWGAHGQKLFFGKMVTGVLRSTFLIEAGKVTRIWKVDRVKGHAAEVLAAVRSS
jgi:thioredoxin-dependent peroxiredoxin